MVTSFLKTGLLASIMTLLVASTSAQSAEPSATNSPKAVETLGCYSKIDNFVSQGTYTYQTSGYCQILCSNLFKNVMATSEGSTCYCGNLIPATGDIASNSSCSSPCNGYSQEDCGGNGFYTVYLTGMSSDVEVEGSSSSSSSSPSTTPKSGSSSSSASPSVVTKAGQTIIVTAPSTANDSKSSGSKVGIAVGVVVGVLAIAGIAGGALLYMKQRRKKAVEEEFRRNAALDNFVRGKSETSSTNDQRLDPSVFAHRRQSIGSIADERDFSRRILAVRNPDNV